jgi:hypothetical protein
LVDGGAGLSKLLLADGCALADGGDEPKGDGLGSAVDIIVFITHDHAEEGLGYARQDRWVWAPIREVDTEGWCFGNFLHGRSGGQGDVLGQHFPGNVGMEGSIEVSKDLCWVDEGGLRFVGAEGIGLWGVDGRVGVSGHALSVIGAKGVSAESGAHIFVFKGLRWSALLLFPVSAALLLVSGGIGGNQGVVVQVPGGRGWVPIQGRGVKCVEAVSVVG